MTEQSEWGEYGYELSSFGRIVQHRLVKVTASQVRYINSRGTERRSAISNQWATWFPSLEAAEDSRLARFACAVECAQAQLERAKAEFHKAEDAKRESYYTPCKET